MEGRGCSFLGVDERTRNLMECRGAECKFWKKMGDKSDCLFVHNFELNGITARAAINNQIIGKAAINQGIKDAKRMRKIVIGLSRVFAYIMGARKRTGEDDDEVTQAVFDMIPEEPDPHDVEEAERRKK